MQASCTPSSVSVRCVGTRGVSAPRASHVVAARARAPAMAGQRTGRVQGQGRRGAAAVIVRAASSAEDELTAEMEKLMKENMELKKSMLLAAFVENVELKGRTMELERKQKEASDLLAQRKAESEQAARTMNVQDIATSKANTIAFTIPESPVAGGECMIYVNRRRTALENRPNVYCVAGWNKWSAKLDTKKESMSPAGLNMTDSIDWWHCRIQFTDGESGENGVWDNNSNKDYVAQISQ